MSTALEALAHLSAILALCLFVGWIAALLVTDPPRSIVSRDFNYRLHQCGCGRQVIADPRASIPFGWKSINGTPECPECLGLVPKAQWEDSE